MVALVIFVVMERFQGKKVSRLQPPLYECSLMHIMELLLCMRKMMFTLKRNLHRKFWINVAFAFLLDKFEMRYWEYSKQAIKNKKLKKIVASINTHFQTNV
jgi:hypothetical protein